MLVAAALVGGVVASVGVTGGGGPRAHPGTGRGPAVATSLLEGPIVSPEAPAALAAGPDGTLFLIDTQRREVLGYTAAAGFRLVAGGGRVAPRSGVRARAARLKLGWWSGIAVSSAGELYFTSGGRVLEVLASGRLRVVAGGGSEALGHRSLPALHADLGACAEGCGPTGLTFGPGGRLFVGTADGVYWLGGHGVLHWFVGENIRSSRLGAGWSVGSNPAHQNDFTSVAHLAFDAHGDLYVSGGDSYNLYERSAAGKLRYVEVLRAQGGSPGALAFDAADGTVLAASGLGLRRVAGSGEPQPLTVRWPRGSSHWPVFDPAFGNGVSVGTRGQIYVDTDFGDSFPDQGLLEVASSGGARWLWGPH